jgi:hypothetical protein
MTRRSNMRQLNHRLDAIEAATGYVEDLGTAKPLGQSCEDYDHEEFQGNMKPRASKNLYCKELWDCLRTISEKIFPIPIQEIHGEPFDKGLDFLIAAISHANLELADYQKRVRRLVEVEEEIIQS